MLLPEVLEHLAREFPLVTHQTPQNDLWHYTNAQGLMGIVSREEIWATHFAHLNDTEELRFGHELVSRALEEVGRKLYHAEPNEGAKHVYLRVIREHWAAWRLGEAKFYIASFCDDGGNTLGQWRGYGAFGAGYSIGFGWLPQCDGLFQVRYVNPANLDGTTISQVEYFIARAASLEPNATPDVTGHIAQFAFQLLVTTVMSTKNKAFEAEREWRLLVVAHPERDVEYRAAERGIVPFVRIPLHRPGEVLERMALAGVFVGPANEPIASVAAVASFLGSHGYKEPEDLVRASGISFRGR